jgi:hypothetical protein
MFSIFFPYNLPAAHYLHSLTYWYCFKNKFCLKALFHSVQHFTEKREGSRSLTNGCPKTCGSGSPTLNTNLSEVLQRKNKAVVRPLQHSVSLILNGADQLAKLLKKKKKNMPVSSFFQGCGSELI